MTRRFPRPLLLLLLSGTPAIVHASGKIMPDGFMEVFFVIAGVVGLLFLYGFVQFVRWLLTPPNKKR